MTAPQTIIFIGSQGSGKGTQARRLKEYMEKEMSEIPTLLFATGEGFRQFAKGNGITEEHVGDYLSKGKILPSFLPIWLWTKMFIENSHGTENILFDGSPRTRFEAEVLETAFEFYGREKVLVLTLEVPRTAIIERLLNRKREDDTEVAIEERVSWYERNVEPILDFFKENKRYDILNIDGSVEPDSVFKEIVSKVTYI